METKIIAGIRGWEARSEIPLDDGLRVLVISTHKVDGGKLMTWARGWKLTNTGHLMTEMFSDFKKCIYSERARCTHAAVDRQQTAALAQALEIKAEAEAFYKAKDGGVAA